MSGSASELPPEFACLEPFVAQWAVSSMGERHRRRLASTAADRKAFYDSMSPRLHEVMDYLNRFPLHEMPQAVATLMRLSMSLMEVSLTQEVYNADVESVHAKSSRRVYISQEMDEF
jgi:hypothetical protein